jgi:hypothetical protein
MIILYPKINNYFKENIWGSLWKNINYDCCPRREEYNKD